MWAWVLGAAVETQQVVQEVQQVVEDVLLLPVPAWEGTVVVAGLLLLLSVVPCLLQGVKVEVEAFAVLRLSAEVASALVCQVMTPVQLLLVLLLMLLPLQQILALQVVAACQEAAASWEVAALGKSQTSVP